MMKIMITLALSLILLTASSCSGLFYYPTQALYSNPSNHGLEFQNIYFETPDQQTLHSWYFPSTHKEPKGLIFHFHGNAQNITSHYQSLSWLIPEGYGLFIFDYRGYGLSTGQPNQAGLIQDSRAAYEKLQEIQAHTTYPKLIFYGQSLGGIVMMRFLEEVDPSKVDLVVLDSTFPSYQGIAREKLQKSWALAWLRPLTGILIDETYAPKTFFEQWDGRVLVIHGDQDPVVESKFGQEIFERLKTPSKEYWNVKSIGHTDAYFLPEGNYRQKLLDYLELL
jgi:uncharacterized protein